MLCDLSVLAKPPSFLIAPFLHHLRHRPSNHLNFCKESYKTTFHANLHICKKLSWKMFSIFAFFCRNPPRSTEIKIFRSHLRMCYIWGACQKIKEPLQIQVGCIKICGRNVAAFCMTKCWANGGMHVSGGKEPIFPDRPPSPPPPPTPSPFLDQLHQEDGKTDDGSSSSSASFGMNLSDIVCLKKVLSLIL